MIDNTDKLDKDALIKAIERQLLIDALEADLNKVDRRSVRGLLEESYKAWKIWSFDGKEIRRAIGFTSLLGCMVKKHNKDVKSFADDNLNGLDGFYLNWFGIQIESLPREYRQVIYFEHKFSPHRERRSAWRMETGIQNLNIYRDTLSEANRLMAIKLNKIM